MGEEATKKALEKYAKVMETLHKKAREEGREFGFMFCKRDEEIIPSLTTTGGRRALEKIVDCKMFGAKPKGYFHTHPSDLGLSIPAPSDVCFAIAKNLDFLCLSGEIPGPRIACWQLKKVLNGLLKSCDNLIKAKNPKQVSEAETKIREEMEHYLEHIYAKPL